MAHAKTLCLSVDIGQGLMTSHGGHHPDVIWIYMLMIEGACLAFILFYFVLVEVRHIICDSILSKASTLKDSHKTLREPQDYKLEKQTHQTSLLSPTVLSTKTNYNKMDLKPVVLRHKYSYISN